MSDWEFAALVICLVTGGVVLIWGLRKRKLDGFPHCRKCEHDLSGLSRRPRRLLLAGLLTSLGAGIPLGFWGCEAPRTVDRYSEKNARGVMSDAADANTGTAAKAYKELLRRLEAGLLSAEQNRRLAGLVLTECQTTPPRSFQIDHLALDLVYELHRRGCLTLQELSQFYESRFTISMKARPLSSLQEGVPVKLDVDAPYNPKLSLRVSVDPPRLQQGTLQTCGDLLTGDWYHLPELPREIPEELLNRPYRSNLKPPPWQGSESPTMLVKVRSTGKHTLHFVVGTSVWSRKAEDSGKPLYQVRRELTVSTEVLDRDPADIIQQVTDPNMEDAVRRSVSASMGGTSPYSILGPTWNVWLTIVSPPVAIAGTAVLQIQDTEVRRITFAVGANHSTELYFERVRGVPPAKPLTLRLIPDTSAAVKTMDVTRIWGKPLEFSYAPANAAFSASAPASAHPPRSRLDALQPATAPGKESNRK